jgi:hypothetical protein
LESYIVYRRVQDIQEYTLLCRLLPQVAKRELALECDYSWEFAGQSRFKQLVEEDEQLRGLVSQGGSGSRGLDSR